MKVFRYGTFYEYDETYADESWDSEQLFQAASFYASCCHLKFEKNMCYSLSYMYVTSQLQPETLYDTEYQKLILRVTGE